MTKKKIAILTQTPRNNYGGIIQNYALQKVLKDMGHQPETINRVKRKRLTTSNRIIGYIRNTISKHILNRNIIAISDERKIVDNNIKFIEENIEISSSIHNTSEISNYFSKHPFDAVIVGSDQTWRPKYSPDIYNFYLDFLEDNQNIRKLAYASSFGTSDWEYTEEQTQRVSELAKQFDAISVREASGVDLCREKLGVEAVHLLDPTLLLTAEDYNELINQPKANKGLFTYVLDESKDKQDFIKSIGEQLNLKQHINQAKKFDPKVKRPLEELIIPPLEGWLQGFRDAEFVITDSFHGTVFSIINKKPFIALVNVERGASRFESILSKLGLEERMVYDLHSFDKSVIKKPIDYEAVHQKLNPLKEESLSFLKDNI